ncbi:sporulation protein [Amycolatopsis sp. 195334CR]|uniref:sporulation protein n=1 Tax=Amycolatopsis sp. 195334CR TaxID=2814588 RepID=UPI001A8DBACD|nr:sporulation protein [Amycolatopsis sp. 195334CR]MBN6041988.1 sporulation protein [Amycolatopsis sp. 195334CR]
MFKRMLSAFGVGGPSVDTVLDSPAAVPGGTITGQVRIQGGKHEAKIDRIELSLVTRVEAEHHDRERVGAAEFHRVVVRQDVRVAAGEAMDVPFELPVPWETPVTAVGSAQLRGMVVGVRTELVIAGAPDKGDLDPVAVHPLPSQEAVLDAFGELGFQFHSADVEVGRLHGVPQRLDCFQELEFSPPREFAGRINEVELTFVATPHELHVVLEADKRGGMFRSGGDAFGRFGYPHEEAERVNWAELVGQWLSRVAESRPSDHYGHHGHHDEYGHHARGGPGMGAVVGGVAAGVVGGMVLGEVFDEMGDLGEMGDFGEE